MSTTQTKIVDCNSTCSGCSPICLRIPIGKNKIIKDTCDGGKYNVFDALKEIEDNYPNENCLNEKDRNDSSNEINESKQSENVRSFWAGKNKEKSNKKGLSDCTCNSVELAYFKIMKDIQRRFDKVIKSIEEKSKNGTILINDIDKTSDKTIEEKLESIIILKNMPQYIEFVNKLCKDVEIDGKPLSAKIESYKTSKIVEAMTKIPDKTDSNSNVNLNSNHNSNVEDEVKEKVEAKMNKKTNSEEVIKMLNGFKHLMTLPLFLLDNEAYEVDKTKVDHSSMKDIISQIDEALNSTQIGGRRKSRRKSRSSKSKRKILKASRKSKRKTRKRSQTGGDQYSNRIWFYLSKTIETIGKILYCIAIALG